MSLLDRLNPLRVVENTIDAIDAVLETGKAVVRAGDRMIGDGDGATESMRTLSSDAKSIMDDWERGR